MIYSDILLDENGDLRLDSNNDIILTDSLVQKINIQLKWFLGEWVFDESRGRDWFGTVFVKNPDEDDITTMVENVISSFSKITEVTSVTIDADERTRKATITWKATTGEDNIESEVKLWGKSTE